MNLEVGQTVRVNNPDLDAYGYTGKIVDIDLEWEYPYEIKFIGVRFEQELYKEEDIDLVISRETITKDEELEMAIRKVMDNIDLVRGLKPNREVSIAITKLQEAKMWLSEAKNNG